MTMPFSRSRHERFQCVGTVIMREKIDLVQHVCVSPAECLSRNFHVCFRRGGIWGDSLENTFQKISQYHYTRARVLDDVDALRECTCKYESKRKSCKGSKDQRPKTYKYKRKTAKSNTRVKGRLYVGKEALSVLMLCAPVFTSATIFVWYENGGL